MNPRPPNQKTFQRPSDRPLSTIELLTPNSDDDLELVFDTLKRKHSLDHGEYSSQNWRTRVLPPAETPRNDNDPPEVDNNNGDVTDNAISLPQQNEIKKQKSFESIGCDEYYFYDFFDRNAPETETTEGTRRDESGPSRETRRPRSWLSTAKYPEETRRLRRRKTDPLAKDFRSDYEEALSSLLWQPYECRTEVNTSLDDSDVAYWLNCNKRWKESSDSSSRSSISSSSSSDGKDYIRRLKESKIWSKEESSSSIRGLLKVSPSRIGNVEEISDLDSVVACSPLGALSETGWETSQCETRCGGERERDKLDMLVNVLENSEPRTSSVSTVGIVSATSDGVSVVNCYRAVPATVSSVPSVPCNISNVRIVQDNNVRCGDFNARLSTSDLNARVGTTEHDRTQSGDLNARIQQNHSDSNARVGTQNQTDRSAITPRTFTSTEAQTDDVVVNVNNREQRRRERRERRHQRRLNNTEWQTQVMTEPLADRLPDILNSHLPPPYTTLPIGLPPPTTHVHLPPPPPPTVPVLPPPIAVTATGSPPPPAGGLRFPFAIVPPGRRRSRLSPHYTPEDEPKSCCGVSVSQTISIRWFIVLIALVGICCAIVGTVLGAMKASGKEHLTVSLLMIGVGIVLVTVSGVAWRLTSHDAPSCRAMLGLGGADDTSGEPNRRFVPRLPPSYGRPHHPYAAMMYPEFQYRAPPPSYQASMQEYRLRLLLLDRHSGGVSAPIGNGVSPPPTYRSHAGSLLRAPIGFTRRELTQHYHTHTPSQSEYSRPPSYRSRTSSTRPSCNPDPNNSIGTHSRDPSQLSGSDPGLGSSAVNVITVMGHNPEHTEAIIKMVPEENLAPLALVSKGKDSNLVTIVQTASESSGPVIVTISGTENDGSSSQCCDTEMEILAHL